jgi:hypothetical protein
VKPLLLPLEKGEDERNYFQCIDAAFGGLIAEELNAYQQILNIYSICDAPKLSVSKNDNDYHLSARAIGVHLELLNLLQVTLKETKFKSTLELDEVNINRPFLISFNEMFVKEYSNYQKRNHYHYSLGLEIKGSKVTVLEPRFTYQNGRGVDEKDIDLQELLDNEPESFIVYTINDKVDAQSISFDEIEKLFVSTNLNIWHTEEVFETEDVIEYVGFNALIHFAKLIENQEIVMTVSSKILEWVYGFKWKQYYYEHNNRNSEIAQILEEIVKELNVFGTIVFRLSKKYRSNLHTASIEKWKSIKQLFKNYQHEEVNYIKSILPK